MDYVAHSHLLPEPRVRVAFHVYASGNLKAKDVEGVARMADVAGGLVVRRRKGLTIARAVRGLGFDGPIMVDPGVYEKLRGTDREAGDDAFGGRNGVWCDTQDDLGVSAHLSPSDYVPACDYGLLDHVLAEGKGFCDQLNGRPGYIVLPVDAMWLSRDPVELAARAGASGYPIALALGAEYNPLDSLPKVSGLVLFLRRVPGTLMMRTDVSCVGAIAYGAMGAAYGSTGGGRHVWPPGSTGGSASPSVLVPSLLDYVRIDRIEQLPKVDGMLDCPVGGCTIGGVDQLAQARYTAAHRAAHDLHIVRWLVDAVVRAADPASVWKWYCDQARALHEEVSALGGPRLGEHRHVRAWRAFAET